MHWSPVLAVLGVLALAAGAGADEAADKAVRELEGQWLVVGIETDGRAAGGDEVKGMRWSIQGGEIRAQDPDGAASQMAFALDPGKAPREITVTALDGRQKGKTMIGIYDVKDGRLRVCLRDSGAAAKGRPTAFGAAKGSELALITLERAKVKK